MTRSMTILPIVGLAALAASDAIAERTNLAPLVLDFQPHSRSLPKAHNTANQKAARKRKRNRKNPQFTRR